MLTTFLLTVWTYVHEIAEIVVLGFVVAGIIDAVVNKAAIARYLGGSLIGSNLLGAAIGIVTPLCCCSAIPTAMALYRAGSRRGPACAFLIATPWFNWYGLTALLIFLGPTITVAVAGSAILIAISTGILIDLFMPATAGIAATEAAGAPVALVSGTGAGVLSQAAVDCGCDEAGCCTPALVPDATPASAPLLDFSNPMGKFCAGVRFAVTSLREIGPWMAAGILIGAAIETFVPEGVFTRFLGGATLLGLLAALVVAGLFSGDSLGSLPWVKSLVFKGLGAGSAMILLVAGVGTNLSTLGPVGQVMGRRTAVWYVVSVVLLAAIFGFILNRIC